MNKNFFPSLESFQDNGVSYYYKLETTSVKRLAEIRADMENLAKANRLSNNKVFRRYLSRLTNTVPDHFPSAKSVIIVALFKPLLEIRVQVNHRTRSIFIPPNYLKPPDYALDDPTFQALAEVIRKRIIKQADYTVQQAFNINLKRLAVRSGLGKYGRNNLCYVDELGSLHTLMAFFSDFEFPEDHWMDPQLMESCRSCKACVNSCPNKAIPESLDDIIIDVEKCLPLYNEIPGEIPEWIPRVAHNALIGCFICQKVCPANQNAWNAGKHRVDLTEEETEMILNGTIPQGRLAEMRGKLTLYTHVDELLPVLKRNLTLLLR